MDKAIEQANKNWREANTIGERLGMTAEGLTNYINAKAVNKSWGTASFREDLTVRVASGRI